jgi:SAM-dependent methyltransferase
MSPAIPERIRLAVELVDPRPGEQILEIGCGSGVAAALVAERLESGHLTAIDRSATAVGRTRARTEAFADRVTVAESTLAGYLPDRTFDKVFCVNVNVFWTGPAERELEVVSRCLRPGGLFFACYETLGRRAELEGRVTEALARAGLITRTADSPLLCVVGRRPGTS